MAKPQLARTRRVFTLMPVGLAIFTIATAWAYSRVLQNGFVNWDDPTVLLQNEHLGQPGVARWAFSTGLIGHYQPLAWLAWSTLKSLFGLSPAAFHGLSLLLHVAAGIAVYAVALRLADRMELEGIRRRIGGLLAASLFLLHPAAVEPVAWASALPYVLSLFLLLLSFLAYVNERKLLSGAFYAGSLLSRATALGYPLVLVTVDLYLLNRQQRTTLRRVVIEKIPFVLLAIAAALGEWYSRDVAGLSEMGLAPRVATATAAPFVYIWRTVWPVRLSPIYALPLSPSVELLPLAMGIAGMTAMTAIAWSVRRRQPVIPAAWIVYLTLLAPVAGLTPTGVQASADRYMYVPSVVIAMVVGIGVAGLRVDGLMRGLVALTTVGALAALALLTRSQTQYWKDSIALWTRAADVDRGNDVATYNLAAAYGETGRDREAMQWYERTLALVPDHDLARRNLAILQAVVAERDADQLAAAGHVAEATDKYRRAIALDPRRVHAHAALGVILAQRGQFDAASVELRRALEGGVQDVEVPNALAFALLQNGEEKEAANVLARATADHPDNLNLKHNLARLLATASDPQVRDGERALRLASEVCEQMANGDPRALDTLSAAYAAVGRFDLAQETAARAEHLARARGDLESADAIAAHARSYRRPLTR
jgi:Flp pilus assembly protein TadD